MSFNFPDAPIVGQVFSPYEWDGEKWVMQIKPGKGDAVVSVGDTPPPAPTDGQFWWCSSSGILYFRYNDGSSAQWVVAAPGEKGDQGNQGPRVILATLAPTPRCPDRRDRKDRRGRRVSKASKATRAQRARNGRRLRRPLTTRCRRPTRQRST